MCVVPHIFFTNISEFRMLFAPSLDHCTTLRNNKLELSLYEHVPKGRKQFRCGFEISCKLVTVPAQTMDQKLNYAARFVRRQLKKQKRPPTRPKSRCFGIFFAKTNQYIELLLEGPLNARLLGFLDQIFPSVLSWCALSARFLILQLPILSCLVTSRPVLICTVLE